ncbi:MAG: hypothetical protein LBF57_03760 [Holosporaceae bacterium]|jgi:hypothetical protein|nr:hypothetical protein [Holosporaceae bacterium]
MVRIDNVFYVGELSELQINAFVYNNILGGGGMVHLLPEISALLWNCRLAIRTNNLGKVLYKFAPFLANEAE